MSFENRLEQLERGVNSPRAYVIDNPIEGQYFYQGKEIDIEKFRKGLNPGDVVIIDNLGMESGDVKGSQVLTK